MTKASGIYAIVNRESGKLYIGSAVNIAQRWQDHLKRLRGNCHHSRRLQNAWNKYGEGAFAFAVVRFCSVANLISEEQRWIDEMEAVGRHGYNVSPTAGSPLGIKRTEETRAKMSASAHNRTPEARAKNAAANRGKKRSPEAIAKTAEANRGRKNTAEALARMSAACQGRKPTPEALAKSATVRRGRKLTPEHAAKISAGNRGKKLTPEAIARTAAAKRGKKRDPETCAKISASLRGRKLTPEARAKFAAACRQRWAEKKAARESKPAKKESQLAFRFLACVDDPA